MAEKNQDQMVEIDIDLLQPNPLQPRGSIPADSLMELAESIRAHGILEPIVVAHTPAGYQIIAGERRWRASKIAGLSKVQAVVKHVSPDEMLLLAIVENLQREDLNVFEKAAGYKRLNEEFGMTHEQIARQLGVSRPTVSNNIRMLNLPDIIKDALLSGTISISIAESLLQLRTPEMMIQLFTTKVLRENFSVRQIEELARRLEEKGEIERGIGRPLVWKRTKQTKEIEDDLMTRFKDTKVDLTRSKRQIKIILKFKDEDVFNDFLDKMGDQIS